MGAPGDFSIGMQLELGLETLRQDADGNDVVIYRFTPWRRTGEVRGTAIAGVGQLRFGMYRNVPAVELARDAGLLALHDAGLTLAEIDEVFVGYLGLQHQVGVKAVKELGLTGLPVTHIENASATGLFAFRERRGPSPPVGPRSPWRSPSTR